MDWKTWVHYQQLMRPESTLISDQDKKSIMKKIRPNKKRSSGMTYQQLKFTPMNWVPGRPYITDKGQHKGFKLSYPNMVNIETIADGSCFFHAIANAFFLPYWEHLVVIDGRRYTKREFIRRMRHDLAIRLAQSSSSGSHYDNLSNGNLKEFATAVPNYPYTLEKMQAVLRSNSAVDYVYFEFISNQLNKDIYILNALHQDVTPIDGIGSLYYKKRASIVLLYFPGHYELVGLLTGDPHSRQGIETIFAPDHPFIQAIRKRLTELSQ